MPKAYLVYLDPVDIEGRTEYVIIPDDMQIPDVDDTDAHDMILCDNEGYQVVDVVPVSLGVAEAAPHHYEI